MAICKFCNVTFAWGRDDANEKWVPLIPVGDEGEFDRTFQDEGGNLRAHHHLVCVNRGGPTVRVTKLARSVKASDIIGQPTPPSFKEKYPEKIDPETGEIFSCKVKRKPRFKLKTAEATDVR